MTFNDSLTPALVVFSGVSLHLFFFRIYEHHLYAVRYIKVSLLVFLVLPVAIARFSTLTLSQSLWLSSEVEVLLLLGLYGSLITYRLFWHPLRSFPGPFWARVTSLWLPTKLKKHDNHRVATELNNTYGHFVRVGSNDLMIAHPHGVPAVYSAQSKCRKGPWYDIDLPKQSIHMTRDHQWHHEQRRIWSRAFGEKNLKGYEKRIAVYNKAFIDQMIKSQGKPVNATMWLSSYGFDVMGDLAFNKDFGGIANGKTHWAVDIAAKGMASHGPKLPTWLLRLIVSIPGAAKGYQAFAEYSNERLAEQMAQPESDSPCMMDIMLEQHLESGPITPEKLLNIQHDTRTLIIAGSDTVGTALTFFLYFLALYPEHAVKIREEVLPLQGPDGFFENKTLQNAQHLNAFVNEAFRLYPVPPTDTARITPPEGINVAGTHIPGGVNVWCPLYTIGRSEIAYEKPSEFIPERWYSEPSLVKYKDAFAPFQIGPYNCVGKALALIEIRTMLAALVSKFDIRFESGKELDFLDNLKDHFVWALPELKLRFIPLSKVDNLVTE